MPPVRPCARGRALPWFTNVREKLDDPAYSHWFLKFKPGGSLRNGSWHVPACTGSGAARKCSALYHDQEQTPEHPAGDGSCADWCDCGAQPCGEYLWDWREPSLLPWMVAEVTGAAALGNAAVDFLFIDDYWCAHLVNGSGACHDPVQGPSEIDAHSQADMGLSDADVAALTRGWLRAMTAVQQAVVDAGGYTWSLFPGQQNANASPTMVTPQSCAAALRAACSPRSAWQRQPLTYGLAPGNSTAPLPQLEQDMAAFLLMRGPYAYVGWGVWGMSWPVGVSWNSHGTPVARKSPLRARVARCGRARLTLPLLLFATPGPPMLDADYGSPLSTCVESSPGVFTRAYTKAAVALDCNKWQGNITMQQR